MRTADFQDADNNGIDDRDEKADRNQRHIKGQDPSSNPQNQTDTTSSNLQTLYKGQAWGNSLMNDLFSNGGTEEDDGRANMRNAFQFDVGSKFINTQLGMAQSEFNLAQNKEVMAYANMMDRQTMQEARNHIFGLNMKTMDKQFSLNDEFANRDYARNLGMLGATGEQTRKNYQEEGQQQRLGMLVAGEQQRLGYAAQGQQDRLGTIVSGEQQRLGIAATGHQQRLGTMVAGHQQRLGIQETGRQTRANYRVEGEEQRAGIRTAGEEQRKGIAATGFQTRLNIDRQGVNDRLGYRVQGDEQRKNIAATGIENRKQAVTEGEQKRLNIGKTAEEERTTMSHSDNIAAGREKRQSAAARAATRAF